MIGLYKNSCELNPWYLDYIPLEEHFNANMTNSETCSYLFYDKMLTLMRQIKIWKEMMIHLTTMLISYYVVTNG